MWLLVPPLYGTHAEVCLPVTQALLPAAVSAQSFSAYTSTPPLHRRDDTSLSLLLLSLSLSLSPPVSLSLYRCCCCGGGSGCTRDQQRQCVLYAQPDGLSVVDLLAARCSSIAYTIATVHITTSRIRRCVRHTDGRHASSTRTYQSRGSVSTRHSLIR